jgi:hypothetical protein
VSIRTCFFEARELYDALDTSSRRSWRDVAEDLEGQLSRKVSLQEVTYHDRRILRCRFYKEFYCQDFLLFLLETSFFAARGYLS